METFIGGIAVLFILYIVLSWVILPLTLNSIEKSIKEIKENLKK